MKVGFIGLGNMATAMVTGMLEKEVVVPKQVIGSNPSEGKRIEWKEKFSVHTTDSNVDVVKSCDILFLSIKPQFYQQVIFEIRDYVREDQIIISIAAGKSLQWIKELFLKEVKIVRCMPNTPALVLEGCTGVCHNELVTESEIKEILRILSCFGKASLVSESMMDAVVGVSGSSPAYVFLFIEAMADAAVAAGMPRLQAYEFAAQAVMGSAKMVLETGKHPGELKDMVCSPGGTTIQAVRVLEEKGFRSAVIEAMNACIEKSKNL